MSRIILNGKSISYQMQNVIADDVRRLTVRFFFRLGYSVVVYAVVVPLVFPYVR